MRIAELIAHYRKVKTQYGELPPSLESKLPIIEQVFGHLDASTTGSEIVSAAKEKWKGSAPGTIRRYLVQVKAILNRAERDGLIAKAPMVDLPYVHDVVYVDITNAELNMLLDYIKWTEPRWYPLALTLSHTGARLSEALALTEASFTKLGTRILKSVGRRTKTIERVVPYTQRMQDAVASGAIFRNGQRLAPQGYGDSSIATCLGRVIDQSVKALGLPPMRVHDLRHAFAAVLAENGADLADLVAALGHSSTAMSMRYRGLVRGRLGGIMATIK